MNHKSILSKNRSNPHAALKAKWAESFVPIDDSTRTAMYEVNGRYKSLLVKNYANGLTIEYALNNCPLTFSHHTDAVSIAATFNLCEHTQEIAELIDFGGPGTEVLEQVSNLEEQY